MFLTFLLFQTSTSQVFLQLSQTSESSESTQSSKVSLSTGLKTYSDSLSEFGDRLSSGISSLDQSINQKLDHSYSVASSLLDTRINELSNEKSSLDYEIETLNKKLKLLSSSCETFSRCVDCLNDPGCVWCSAGICVAGDDEGPYQNECDFFEYSYCPKQSCKDFLTCSSCTAEDCGWCESTLECFEGTAKDSGNCDNQFYYHQNYRKCYQEADKAGEMKEVNAFKAKNPTNSIDPAVQNIENQLEKDYARYAEIEEEIDVNLFQKENIYQNMKDTKSVHVLDIEVESVESYSQQVREMEEQEMKKSHEFQEKTVKDAGQRVIDYTDEIMQKMTDQVIEAIQNLTAYYEAKLDKIEDDFNQQQSDSNNTTQTNSTAT
jgi:hypothetical protein